MVLLLVLCAVSAVSSICRVFFWSLCPKKPSRASACASSAPSGGGSIEKDTHLDWIHCSCALSLLFQQSCNNCGKD